MLMAQETKPRMSGTFAMVEEARTRSTPIMSAVARTSEITSRF